MRGVIIIAAVHGINSRIPQRRRHTTLLKSGHMSSNQRKTKPPRNGANQQTGSDTHVQGRSAGGTMAMQRDVLHTNTTYPSSVGRLQPGVDGNQQRGINHFGAMPSRTDVYSQTSLNDIVTELTLLRSLCETKFSKLEETMTNIGKTPDTPRAQSHLSGSEGQQSSWSIKSFLPGGSSKCSQCEVLKRQLEQKEIENKRLASQINAEMRKMQGNLGQNSSDDCKQMFMLFFSNTVDRLVQQYQPHEAETKRQILEHICKVFQNVFEQVKALLEGQLTQSLTILFDPSRLDESSLPPGYNDIIRAYGRLLSACGITGPCQIKPEMLENNDIDISTFLNDNRDFLTECISLSWKLLTTVPPLLPHCPSIPFNERMHEDIPGKCGGITHGKPLLYSKPILTNCTGKVYVHGSVRSADKAKSR